MSPLTKLNSRMPRECEYSFLHLHELTYQRCNIICFGIKSEVSGVENMNLSVRHIQPVPLRLAEIKRQIVLAPDHQQARLLLAHPRLPFWIGLHICSIVIKQIALDLCLGGLVEEIEFIGPQIRVVAFHIWIVPDMAGTRGRERQEIRAQCTFVGRAIGPKSPPRLPDRAQALVVRDSILDDETLDSIRMGQGHAKTHGAAVILHVKRVAREPKS